jgi:hypothetical protein
VIGKAISPTVIHLQTILAAMRPAWGNPRGLRARSVGVNLFMADFATKLDRDRALEGTPWMVGRHAVLLQEYNPNLKPSEIRFESMDIWVRILDIPIGWMNEKKGGKLARLVGPMRKLDVDDQGEASGSYFRARIGIPINKPLRRWVTTENEKTNSKVRYDLQYEKLPYYCFSCGLIGHSELECPEPAERDETGKLPYDRKLRAPDDRRKKMQNFSQAAASASWNSGSRDSGEYIHKYSKSSPNNDATHSPEKREMERVLEMSSPLSKSVDPPESYKDSELAKQLFPLENQVPIPLQKKCKTTRGNNPKLKLVSSGSDIREASETDTRSGPFALMDPNQSVAEGTKKQKMELSSFNNLSVEAANVVQPRRAQCESYA